MEDYKDIICVDDDDCDEEDDGTQSACASACPGKCVEKCHGDAKLQATAAAKMDKVCLKIILSL